MSKSVMTKRMSMWAAHALLITGVFTASVSMIGCSGSDTSTPQPAATKGAAKPASETAAAPSGAPPEWIERSKTWPDTLRFAYDSTLEVVTDGLLLRLRPEVSQDVSGQNFQNERPLQCAVLMTVRPIPEWPLAMGLKIDSISFHDPVKNRDLRSMPMLAYQRAYDNQTVRTQFLLNMADAYRQSPDLTEGQALSPTIYLSWDRRIIIASMPPVTLSFVRTQKG
jgi:hypothetical protein